MRHGWAYLTGLVALASAVPLAQVMVDRSAPPRMTLRLSQREFIRAWREDENTGEALSWSWYRPPEIDSVPTAALAEMGIRCEEARYDCGLRAARAGWMVVAIDTVGWRAGVDSAQHALDSVRALVPQDSEAVRNGRDKESVLWQRTWYQSRLVMVDAGRDPDALAAKWSDGAHLVLRARLTASRISYPRDTLPGEVAYYRVHGEPMPSLLYLPAPWAPVVRDSTLRGSWDRNARYEVVVGVGRGWLPRVLEVTR
ncbi:MAG TPA: DUF4824 family protein [Gemmatimonadales bacterium]|nr:DUF4824 family protein [Gemmatimonadales bacterium]